MTPCREYPVVNKGGYGERRRRKPRLLHRWVMAQVYGEEAIKGKVVMHLCDNPACYRFDHLRIGTQADNLSDMAKKGRHVNTKKTHCPHGHEYTEENTLQCKTARRCKECKKIRAKAEWAGRAK